MTAYEKLLISDYFLENVKKNPHNKAIFVNGVYYTYSDFFLIVKYCYDQIPVDTEYPRIGVFCSDNIYTYASILAINIYGAAYVPLNEKFSNERNIKIIKASRLTLLFSSSPDISIINEQLSLKTIFSTSSKAYESKLWNFGKINLLKRVTQEIAYILFTSGTTGNPKGIEISHFNLKSFFNFFFNEYNFKETDNFLQVYELTFDVSVFSFFMPISIGACVYILPSQGVKYLNILKMLRDYKITVISMVPTILMYLEKYFHQLSFPDLKYCFFSGDSLYYSLAYKWKLAIPNGEIHNFYGPTETTIVCTRFIFENLKQTKFNDNTIVPLGKPFNGMEVLIVNSTNQPTKKGSLCFSGNQVFSGYLDESNKEKFFTFENKLYFNTGDIVSLDINGNIIFHGREDSQVKINGFRVELGEIELTINKIFQRRSKVLCLIGVNKLNKLIAFVESPVIDVTMFLKKLSEILPDYMLPQQIIFVEELPLSLNDKLDINKLLSLIK